MRMRNAAHPKLEKESLPFWMYELGNIFYFILSENMEFMPHPTVDGYISIRYPKM